MVEVSVIIPVFNSEATLGRAITSVIEQSNRDLELIVVDDGSSDHSVAIAQGFAHPSIAVVRHKRNRGAAAARNSGIAAAKGAYVAFLDADDEWFPEKLEIQVASLARSPIDTQVCCTGVMLHFLDRVEATRTHLLRGSDDWVLRLLSGCDQYPGSTLLAKREIFDQIGPFDEALRRLEDWDWLLRYAAAGGKVLAIPQPLSKVYYKIGKRARQAEAAAQLFLVKHQELFARYAASDRRRLICDLWLQISGAYAMEGLTRDAVRLALYSVRQRPIYATRRLTKYAFDLAEASVSRTTPNRAGMH